MSAAASEDSRMSASHPERSLVGERIGRLTQPQRGSCPARSRRNSRILFCTSAALGPSSTR